LSVVDFENECKYTFHKYSLNIKVASNNIFAIHFMYTKQIIEDFFYNQL